MKRIVFLMLISCVSVCQAETPLKVVTTLSTYADLARSIGGSYVEVSYVAPPRFNPHFIEPRPSDVFKLKKADLFIHSGLDLEAWRGPLVDAAARAEIRDGGERELNVSDGLTLLEVPDKQVSRAEGDIHQFGNPHFWIDPNNGRTIARKIQEKLSKLNPEHSQAYIENLKLFQSELDDKEKRWKEIASNIKGKEVVGYHNEWIYLMNYLGIKMNLFVEPKPGIPPSPSHLESLVSSIRERHITGLIQASFYPKEASEYLSEKTAIRPITICQNVGELPECDSYIDTIDYAVTEIAKVIDG